MRNVRLFYFWLSLVSFPLAAWPQAEVADQSSAGKETCKVEFPDTSAVAEPCFGGAVALVEPGYTSMRDSLQKKMNDHLATVLAANRERQNILSDISFRAGQCRIEIVVAARRNCRK